MEQTTNIGDKIKELRKLHHTPQVELADKINVSKQTLYKYEQGIITNIPSDKIEAIADYFSISPAYLMGWQKSPVAVKQVDMTQMEAKVLDHYRKAMPKTQRIVRDLLDIEEE